MSIYDSTLGMLLIAAFISSVLFGLFTSQVYVYHKSFPEESKWIRFGLVDGMWILELAHTIIMFQLIYLVTVTRYGDPLAFLLYAPASMPVVALLHGIIVVMAQGYFTYRIARFGNHWDYPYIIPGVCSILMLCQLLGNTSAAIYIINETLPNYLKSREWLIVGTLIIRASADVIISGTMVYYLVRQRKVNAYKKTNAVIDKLILWTIETGVVTSMLGIVLLICFFRDDYGYAWFGLYLILPKVFSNTMLANMNSRIQLRKMQSTAVISGGVELHFATMPEQSSRSVPMASKSTTSSIVE
ncbi:hypothetical protein GYMLUDRAFT_39530 [Collybiopsis luxurians FD-317 M1]|nr:hypothetical protein GYMLUDRAFT_39530 [Collybiopsis luxurians FD-317 M1]